MKCEECGAYDGHAPRCSLIDFETAKKLLAQYYQCYLDKYSDLDKLNKHYLKQRNKARVSEEFWKGKFNTVKIENNKLRKKYEISNIV